MKKWELQIEIEVWKRRWDMKKITILLIVAIYIVIWTYKEKKWEREEGCREGGREGEREGEGEKERMYS